MRPPSLRPGLSALAAAAALQAGVQAGVQAGCVTARGPEAAARAYAQALEAGRLEEALGHVAPGSTTAEAFRVRYASPEARAARAAEVRAALDGLRAVGPGVEAVPGEGGAWRLVEPAAGAGSAGSAGGLAAAAATPERALGAFLDAAGAGDFTAAYALLAGPLRERYTPEALARDFRAEPEAASRLARARAALARPAERASDAEARFPLGPQRAVRLVREPDGWRVAALE
jgi:hypothetical protein